MNGLQQYILLHCNASNLVLEIATHDQICTGTVHVSVLHSKLWETRPPVSRQYRPMCVCTDYWGAEQMVGLHCTEQHQQQDAWCRMQWHAGLVRRDRSMNAIWEQHLASNALEMDQSAFVISDSIRGIRFHQHNYYVHGSLVSTQPRIIYLRTWLVRYNGIIATAV